MAEPGDRPKDLREKRAKDEPNREERLAQALRDNLRRRKAKKD